MRHIDTLAGFIRIDRSRIPTHVEIVQRDVSGGSTCYGDLSEIAKHEQAESIKLSGLNQEVFERFVADYGGRFKGIYLWKCPKIASLAPLGQLEELEYVAIFWNQRAETLWDMTRNTALRGFSFMDFSRLHHLDCLATAPSLEEVRFGDEVWNGLTVESLEPLARCKRLRTLDFSAKTIVDGRIEPLAAIPAIEWLRFPGNFFMTEQVAWLKARLGERVACQTLAPYWTIDNPLELNGKNRDTFIVGKRKPFLSSSEDAEKIAMYVAKFESLVAEYSEHPELPPPVMRFAQRVAKAKNSS